MTMAISLVRLDSFVQDGRKMIKLECDPTVAPPNLTDIIQGCRWDDKEQCWVFENSTETLSAVFRLFHRKAWVSTEGLVA